MEVTSIFAFFLAITSLCPTARAQDVFEDEFDLKKSLRYAIEDFTLDTYNHLANKLTDKNFVFSPLSLHSALTMVYFGAKDNSTTQKELQQTLGGLAAEDVVKDLYQKLVKDYNSRRSIIYGNHLWVAEGFNLKEDYRNLISRHMNANLSNADFNSDTAAQKVNDWIETLTKGKITDLVSDFSPETQMFLANALYFKQSWKFAFDEKDLKGNKLKADFHFKDEGILPVDMMQLVSRFVEYEEFDLPNSRQGFSVIKIPYENKDLEMKIILPKTKNRYLDLTLLETYLNLTINMDQVREKNILRVVTTPLNYSEVDLMMPKFTVRTKFQAKELFEALGAKEVFTGQAELDKITEEGPIGMGDITHESVVEVTKDGTEGAAATGIEIVFFSSSVDDTKKVVVDKPFIFIVQDKKNTIPLMIGRVVDPVTL